MRSNHHQLYASMPGRPPFEATAVDAFVAIDGSLIFLIRPPSSSMRESLFEVSPGTWGECPFKTDGPPTRPSPPAAEAPETGRSENPPLGEAPLALEGAAVSCVSLWEADVGFFDSDVSG